MKTLKELIDNSNWEIVKIELLNYFTTCKESIEGYEQVYFLLKSKDATTSHIQIYISETVEEEIIYEVDGYDESITDNEEHLCALDFCEWSEWLGMKVHALTYQLYTAEQIIALCLYEMTFHGFDEQSINEAAKKLEEKISKWNSMTDEEKQANCIPLDDLLKKLDL